MQSGLEYLQGWRVKNDRCSCGAQNWILTGFSIVTEGWSKTLCSPRGKIQQSTAGNVSTFWAKTENSQTLHVQEEILDYFNYVCAGRLREIHQRIAISLVVKVQIEFWDSDFQIPGLNQWNKEPLYLSSTSALSFLIMTISYECEQVGLTNLWGKNSKIFGVISRPQFETLNTHRIESNQFLPFPL